MCALPSTAWCRRTVRSAAPCRSDSVRCTGFCQVLVDWCGTRHAPFQRVTELLRAACSTRSPSRDVRATP